MPIQAFTAGINVLANYGPGAVNAGLGVHGLRSLHSSAKVRGSEIERLQRIFNTLTQHINYQQSHAKKLEGRVLLPEVRIEKEEPKEGIPPDSSMLVSTQNTDELTTWLKQIEAGVNPEDVAINDLAAHAKYPIVLERYKELISKRLRYERAMQRIDRSNQASIFFQGAQGVGQIASATAELGHATLAVAKTATYFSLISSFFYLAASVYGLIAFSLQLSKNRDAQAHIHTLLEEINSYPSPAEDATSVVRGKDQLTNVEKDRLKKELAALKSEENLLIQSRNFQLINAIAALMGATATILYLLGTHGFGVIAYYALTVGSGVLPLAAMGYTHFSTNTKKHQQTLANILEQGEAPLPEGELLTQGYMPYIAEDVVTRGASSPPQKKKPQQQLSQELLTNLFNRMTEDNDNNPFHDVFVGEYLLNLLQFLQDLNYTLLKKDLESRQNATGNHIIEYR